MGITFCGHSNVPDAEQVREWLNQVLDQFIYEDEVIFYLGGYGEFDRLAVSVVQEKKQLNPRAQSILVLPYLNRKCDEALYDYTIYPPLEAVPFRYAVSKRNEWMVSESDVVIAYVTHDWSGAANTLEYARRRKKNIIIYSSQMKSIV